VIHVSDCLVWWDVWWGGADMCDVLGGGDVTFHATHEPEEMFKVRTTTE
jgi:hypothetical protein